MPNSEYKTPEHTSLLGAYESLKLELSTLIEENKKLKEELKATQQACELNNCRVCGLIGERDELKSQLVELQADKEMLDWLEKCSGDVELLGNEYCMRVHFVYPQCTNDGSETLRLAITAAMKGTK